MGVSIGVNLMVFSKDMPFGLVYTGCRILEWNTIGGRGAGLDSRHPQHTGIIFVVSVPMYHCCPIPHEPLFQSLKCATTNSELVISVSSFCRLMLSGNVVLISVLMTIQAMKRLRACPQTKPTSSGWDPGSVPAGCVVDIMALGYVFLLVFSSSPRSINEPTSHTHSLIYYRRY